MQTIAQASADLAAGTTTSRALVERSLARIAEGEGPRAFLAVQADAARSAADHIDHMRGRGAAPSPFAGIPVSIKDLFDMAGEVTTAASLALKDAPAAKRDADAVARLRAAGFVPLGRTHMTEFAFSGLGLNPHFETPRNPYDRATGRIAGGSSSGAAVSVTDGMAFAGLGSDTGGSCRIPAALCGLVGFKPTARRVPLDGTLPLAPSLDSIGPLAPTVACCAAVDAVLAAAEPAPLPHFPVRGLRLAVPQTLVLDGLDADVARAFERALSALSDAGAAIFEIPLKQLGEIGALQRRGGFACAEAYAFHAPLIAEKRDLFDPRVLSRILAGEKHSAADYIRLLQAREDLIRRMAPLAAPYDALAMPTTPIVAPAIRDLDGEEAYHRANLAVLRNPTVANLLDRCSISLPCHRAGDPPVGLMLIGETLGDRRLLAIAAAVEKVVSPGVGR